jgi:hypothetical protein
VRRRWVALGLEPISGNADPIELQHGHNNIAEFLEFVHEPEFEHDVDSAPAYSSRNPGRTGRPARDHRVLDV